MEEPTTMQTSELNLRPRMLTVLCILTFIWSGLNIFSSLTIFAFHDAFKVAVEEMAKSFNLANWQMFTEIPKTFFITSAVISSGVVAGAVMMFRLRRNGFHVYTVGQILLILSYMFFYRMSSPPVFDLILGSLFVLLYSRFLKIMR